MLKKKKIHPVVYENKVSETKKARKCSNRNTKSSCDTFKGGTFWQKLFLIFVRLKERDTPHNTIHITTHQENRRKTIISLHFCCHIHYCEFLSFFFFFFFLSFFLGGGGGGGGGGIGAFGGYCILSAHFQAMVANTFSHRLCVCRFRK